MNNSNFVNVKAEYIFESESSSDESELIEEISENQGKGSLKSTEKQPKSRKSNNYEILQIALDELQTSEMTYSQMEKKYGIPKETLEKTLKNKAKNDSYKDSLLKRAGKTYTSKHLAEALEEFQTSVCTISFISKKYGIPHTTFRNRIRKENSNFNINFDEKTLNQALKDIRENETDLKQVSMKYKIPRKSLTLALNNITPKFSTQKQDKNESSSDFSDDEKESINPDGKSHLLELKSLYVEAVKEIVENKADVKTVARKYGLRPQMLYRKLKCNSKELSEKLEKEKIMDKAAKEVIEENLSYSQVANKYGIPSTTLSRRVRINRSIDEVADNKYLTESSTLHETYKMALNEILNHNCSIVLTAAKYGISKTSLYDKVRAFKLSEAKEKEKIRKTNSLYETFKSSKGKDQNKISIESIREICSTNSKSLMSDDKNNDELDEAVDEIMNNNANTHEMSKKYNIKVSVINRRIKELKLNSETFAKAISEVVNMKASVRSVAAKYKINRHLLNAKVNEINIADNHHEERMEKAVNEVINLGANVVETALKYNFNRYQVYRAVNNRKIEKVREKVEVSDETYQTAYDEMMKENLPAKDVVLKYGLNINKFKRFKSEMDAKFPQNRKIKNKKSYPKLPKKLLKEAIQEIFVNNRSVVGTATKLNISQNKLSDFYRLYKHKKQIKDNKLRLKKFEIYEELTNHNQSYSVDNMVKALYEIILSYAKFKETSKKFNIRPSILLDRLRKFRENTFEEDIPSNLLDQYNNTISGLEVDDEVSLGEDDEEENEDDQNNTETENMQTTNLNDESQNQGTFWGEDSNDENDGQSSSYANFEQDNYESDNEEEDNIPLKSLIKSEPEVSPIKIAESQTNSLQKETTRVKLVKVTPITNEIEVCRFCVIPLKTNESVQIDDDIRMDYEIITGQELDVSSKFPQLICTNCDEEFKVAKRIMRRIVQSQDRLLKLVDSKNIPLNITQNDLSSSKMKMFEETEVQKFGDTILQEFEIEITPDVLSKLNQEVTVFADEIMKCQEDENSCQLDNEDYRDHNQHDDNISFPDTSFEAEQYQQDSDYEMDGIADNIENVSQQNENVEIKSTDRSKEDSSKPIKKLSYIQPRVKKIQKCKPSKKAICLQCDHCGRILYNKDKFFKHVMLRHWRYFECKFCDKIIKFSKIQVYYNHMRKHEGDVSNQFNEYVCGECKIVFKTHYTYSAHKRDVHSEFYTCQYCNANFKASERLETHLRKYHSSSTMCELCGDSVSSAKMKAHIDECHFNTYCECGKLYQNKRLYKAHCKLSHEYEPNLTCELCGKSVRNKLKLWHHKHLHHKD